MPATLLILLVLWIGMECAADAQTTNTIVLTNNAGLQWELENQGSGWALGQVSLHGNPVDKPLLSGAICLHPQNNSGDVWLLATNAVQVDTRTATLSGSQMVNGARFRFEMTVSLNANLPEAKLIPHWSVSQTLNGWDVAVAYHGIGTNNWRCTIYPCAGNSMTETPSDEGNESFITNGTVDIERLVATGVPSVILFRPDMSLVALFGIDPAFDYLDFTNWSANTGFYFQNQVTPPQFRIGPSADTVVTSNFIAGVKYVMPLQIILNDSGNSAQAITQLAEDWVQANHYTVQPMSIRTPDQAFEIFLQGRRNTPAWIANKSYEIQQGGAYIYLPDTAEGAFLEYLIYTKTGDSFWRERSLEQMNFLLQSVVTTNTSSPLFGCLNTGYDVGGGFESEDRDNPGYKPDENVMIARYMLQTWALFNQHEGTNVAAWYQTAVNAVNWALAQRNPDGGLPQLLDETTMTPSGSVASGRTMAGLPVIASITGNTNYLNVAQSLEGFVTNQVEGCYWFTGQHPDLPWFTFEPNSIWGLCEYWLDKYAGSGNPSYLQRAEADGWMGFLMLCPGQLRWVSNPTQTCHTEQTYYPQYSNYCYQDKKLFCLYQLGQLTGEPIFTQLFNRVTQCQFWCQETTGSLEGAQYEAMADPWEMVSGDVNWTGSLYIDELNIDTQLQLLQLGMITNIVQDDVQSQ